MSKDPGEPIYRCAACKKFKGPETSIKEHIDSDHSTKFECELCRQWSYNEFEQLTKCRAKNHKPNLHPRPSERKEMLGILTSSVKKLAHEWKEDQDPSTSHEVKSPPQTASFQNVTEKTNFKNVQFRFQKFVRSSEEQNETVPVHNEQMIQNPLMISPPLPPSQLLSISHPVNIQRPIPIHPSSLNFPIPGQNPNYKSAFHVPVASHNSTEMPAGYQNVLPPPPLPPPQLNNFQQESNFLNPLLISPPAPMQYPNFSVTPKSLKSPLKVDVKTKIESDEDNELEQKTPGSDEKCAGCHSFTHAEDLEALKEEEEKAKAQAANQKALMFKKKSHKNKQNDFRWICCDHCSAWYHFLCSGLEQYEYYLYEKFHCPKCVDAAGPSIELTKVSPHRYRWYSTEEKDHKEIEVGTETWITKFKLKESQLPAPNENEVMIVEDGYEFHRKFAQMGGPMKWNKVFLIKKFDGLGMKMPESGTFDIEDVVKCIGEDTEVDTIDVYNQHTFSMKLSTFVKKFRDPRPRTRLYNFLSLEFSDNEALRQHVGAPDFVREISMVDHLWPEYGTKEYERVVQMEYLLEDSQRPKVEEFCLSGMADSYTDFHIDFGGSSVYYHIFKGKKVFYIAAPNEKNLKAFQDHEISKKTHEWFGHKIPGAVKRVVIEEGQTLLIPAGWIHAVWTPEDSLVFGGNFLHLGNIVMQLRIYELENAVRSIVQSDAKFYFPNFEFVHWCYLRNVLFEKVKEYNDEASSMLDSDPTMWNAAKCLLIEMKKWYDAEMIKVFKKDESKEEKLPQYSDLEHKGKLLQSFENQYKKQERIQNDIGAYNANGGSGKKKKSAKRMASNDSSTSDAEYEPYREKKKKKTVKRDSSSNLVSMINGKSAEKVKKELLVAKKEEVEDVEEVPKVDIPSTSTDETPRVFHHPGTLKITVQLEANEDKQNAVQMFNGGRTSSGRKVKVNKDLVDYCGDRLKLDCDDVEGDEEDFKPKLKTFAEYDSEIRKAEAKERGEKEKKERKKANPTNNEPKKEKAPRKPGGGGTAMTSRQRLAKKLKL